MLKNNDEILPETESTENVITDTDAPTDTVNAETEAVEVVETENTTEITPVAAEAEKPTVQKPIEVVEEEQTPATETVVATETEAEITPLPPQPPVEPPAVETPIDIDQTQAQTVVQTEPSVETILQPEQSNTTVAATTESKKIDWALIIICSLFFIAACGLLVYVVQKNINAKNDNHN